MRPQMANPEHTPIPPSGGGAPGPKPVPVSVAIICRDNAKTIGRTLDSLAALAPSEIVAVDSGSRDATVQMLESRGARVIHQAWLGHVRQKQVALEACARPWVLSLDSDESLEPELASAVREAVERDDPRIGAFAMNRRVFYAGRFLDHAWQPEWRTRLVRRGMASWGGYDPHDKLDLTDEARARGLRVERVSGVMRHDSIPTIASFLAKQASHAQIAARSYREMGRRGSVAKLVLSPLGAFAKQIVVRRAFLDGWRGWVAASATAAGVLMKHAALLEISRTSPEHGDE